MAQGDGDAEGKRKAVQRLVAVVQQMFAKDDQLIGLLGFKKNDTADGDNLVASLVESIKEVWEAHRNAAIKQKDEVKQKVQQIIGTRVENLGGTWGHVDDIFLQIDGEISDQLAAISGQEGDARAKAIGAAADTVQTRSRLSRWKQHRRSARQSAVRRRPGRRRRDVAGRARRRQRWLKRIESLSVAAAA